jgi:threonine dehydrogenase-like Zn-dependent dehydrogenase
MIGEGTARRLSRLATHVCSGDELKQNDNDFIGFLRAEQSTKEITKNDEEALKAKYDAFQRERTESSSSKGHLNQYMHLEGNFAEYLVDPYAAEVSELVEACRGEPDERGEPVKALLCFPRTIVQVVSREAINENVEVLIVGGGFSALLTIARLRDAGIQNIRIVEKGGDVGGTW